MFDVDDPEITRINQLTEKVIGLSIEVHRALGPGLLESAYEECICYELSQAGLAFERQVKCRWFTKPLTLNAAIGWI